MTRSVPRSCSPDLFAWTLSDLLAWTLITFGAGALQAQSEVMVVGGPSGSGLGRSGAAAGDLNLDGVPDFLAGTPQLSPGGGPGEVVIAFSGRDGSVIWTFNSPAALIGFGWAVDGGHDVQGDGVPDILIGAPFGGTSGPDLGDGSAYLYSGATGQLIRNHVGQPLDSFGNNVAFIGDVDNDGCAEYAVAAPRGSWFVPGAKQVRTFDGATGNPKVTWTSTASTTFGWTIQVVGDCDGDGAVDFAVGDPAAANFGFNSGRLVVFSTAKSAELFSVAGSQALDAYGLSLAAAGDYNEDGSSDIATSKFGGLSVYSGVETGGVHAILGGVLHSCLCYFSTGGGFPGGKGLAVVSDYDLDGRPEFVIGAKPSGTPALGGSYLASAAKNLLLFHVQQPAPINQSVFPDQVFSIGDIDQDGQDEWVMSGEGKAVVPGLSNGFVGVYSGRPLYAHNQSIASAGGYRVDFDLNAGLPRAGNQYLLLAGATGTTPGVQVKSQVMPLNFDFLTDISIAFANSGPFLSTLGTLDAFGKATATFDGLTLPPIAIGVKLSFAYYTAGPGGVYVSTNPVEIPILGVPGFGQ